jgi:hypothetical protein
MYNLVTISSSFAAPKLITLLQLPCVRLNSCFHSRLCCLPCPNERPLQIIIASLCQYYLHLGFRFTNFVYGKEEILIF